MFDQAYQGGPSFEVLTTQGSNPTAAWRVAPTVQRIYDKNIRGYIYQISSTTSGSSSTGPSLQLPKDANRSLQLVQPLLCFQLCLCEDGQRDRTFALELGVTDTTKTRRRIAFSHAVKEKSVNPLHARFPVVGCTEAVPRGRWVNLCLDLPSVLRNAWGPSVQFKSLDLVSISQECKVRKIFTLRTVGAPIPKGLDFPNQTLSSTVLVTGVVHSLHSIASLETAERDGGGGRAGHNFPSTPSLMTTRKRVGTGGAAHQTSQSQIGTTQAQQQQLLQEVSLDTTDQLLNASYEHDVGPNGDHDEFSYDEMVAVGGGGSSSSNATTPSLPSKTRRTFRAGGMNSTGMLLKGGGTFATSGTATKKTPTAGTTGPSGAQAAALRGSATVHLSRRGSADESLLNGNETWDQRRKRSLSSERSDGGSAIAVQGAGAAAAQVRGKDAWTDAQPSSSSKESAKSSGKEKDQRQQGHGSLSILQKSLNRTSMLKSSGLRAPTARGDFVLHAKHGSANDGDENAHQYGGNLHATATARMRHTQKLQPLDVDQAPVASATSTAWAHQRHPKQERPASIERIIEKPNRGAYSATAYVSDSGTPGASREASLILDGSFENQFSSTASNMNPQRSTILESIVDLAEREDEESDLMPAYQRDRVREEADTFLAGMASGSTAAGGAVGALRSMGAGGGGGATPTPTSMGSTTGGAAPLFLAGGAAGSSSSASASSASATHSGAVVSRFGGTTGALLRNPPQQLSSLNSSLLNTSDHNSSLGSIPEGAGGGSGGACSASTTPLGGLSSSAKAARAHRTQLGTLQHRRGNLHLGQGVGTAPGGAGSSSSTGNPNPWQQQEGGSASSSSSSKDTSNRQPGAPEQHTQQHSDVSFPSVTSTSAAPASSPHIPASDAPGGPPTGAADAGTPLNLLPVSTTTPTGGSTLLHPATGGGNTTTSSASSAGATPSNYNCAASSSTPSSYKNADQLQSNVRRIESGKRVSPGKRRNSNVTLEALPCVSDQHRAMRYSFNAGSGGGTSMMDRRTTSDDFMMEPIVERNAAPTGDKSNTTSTSYDQAEDPPPDATGPEGGVASDTTPAEQRGQFPVPRNAAVSDSLIKMRYSTSTTTTTQPLPLSQDKDKDPDAHLAAPREVRQSTTSTPTSSLVPGSASASTTRGAVASTASGNTPGAGGSATLIGGSSSSTSKSPKRNLAQLKSSIDRMRYSFAPSTLNTTVPAGGTTPTTTSAAASASNLNFPNLAASTASAAPSASGAGDGGGHPAPQQFPFSGTSSAASSSTTPDGTPSTTIAALSSTRNFYCAPETGRRGNVLHLGGGSILGAIPSASLGTGSSATTWDQHQHRSSQSQMNAGAATASLSSSSAAKLYNFSTRPAAGAGAAAGGAPTVLSSSLSTLGAGLLGGGGGAATSVGSGMPTNLLNKHGGVAGSSSSSSLLGGGAGGSFSNTSGARAAGGSASSGSAAGGGIAHAQPSSLFSSSSAAPPGGIGTTTTAASLMNQGTAALSSSSSSMLVSNNTAAINAGRLLADSGAALFRHSSSAVPPSMNASPIPKISSTLSLLQPSAINMDHRSTTSVAGSGILNIAAASSSAGGGAADSTYSFGVAPSMKEHYKTASQRGFHDQQQQNTGQTEEFSLSPLDEGFRLYTRPAATCKNTRYSQEGGFSKIDLTPEFPPGSSTSGSPVAAPGDEMTDHKNRKTNFPSGTGTSGQHQVQIGGDRAAGLSLTSSPGGGGPIATLAGTIPTLRSPDVGVEGVDDDVVVGIGEDVLRESYLEKKFMQMRQKTDSGRGGAAAAGGKAENSILADVDAIHAPRRQTVSLQRVEACPGPPASVEMLSQHHGQHQESRQDGETEAAEQLSRRIEIPGGGEGGVNGYIEVMYDPLLGVYYDPSTLKYYKLKDN